MFFFATILCRHRREADLWIVTATHRESTLSLLFTLSEERSLSHYKQQTNLILFDQKNKLFEVICGSKPHHQICRIETYLNEYVYTLPRIKVGQQFFNACVGQLSALIWNLIGKSRWRKSSILQWRPDLLDLHQMMNLTSRQQLANPNSYNTFSQCQSIPLLDTLPTCTIS